MSTAAAIIENELPANCWPQFALLEDGTDGGRNYVVITPYTQAEKIGGRQIITHVLINWYVSEDWQGQELFGHGRETEAVCGGIFFLS